MSQALERKADALAPSSPREIWRIFATLPSAPGRGWWLRLFLLLCFTIGMMNLGSVTLGRMADLVGQGGRATTVALGIVAVSLLAETTGRALSGFFLQSQVRRWSVEIRQRALVSVLDAPVPEIQELGTGNVLTRLGKDVDTFIGVCSRLAERLAITLFILPITAITMAFIHPLYLLIFAAVTVVMIPFVRASVRDIPLMANMVSSVEAERNNITLDTIRGLDTARSLHLEDWAQERMVRYSWNAVQARADEVPLLNRLIGQGTVAFGLLLLGTLLMSVPMVTYDLVSIGQAAGAVLLAMRLEVHVFNLLFFAGEIQHGLTAIGRVCALTTLSRTAENLPEPLREIPEVRIEDLNFTYPGGHPVLKNVDLTLAAGTTTALVGTSGAGKSTLAALVAGLQYPTSGRIVVGGVDTATVPNTWVTQHVALITQDVHLFSGTLREDLHLAAPGATDEQLLAALADVGLSPATPVWQRWLPQGLDTPIGAGNSEIGAEVAQQVSLARMVLRRSPVLIMDEATSEAGSEHALVLEHAAKAVAKGRTTLIVAHRLDQARDADRIIVMEAGEIVEDGNHDSLIALGGRYARSYAQWSAGAGA